MITFDTRVESNIQLKGLVPSEHPMTVDTSVLVTSSGGTTEDVIIGDANWRNYTAAQTVTEGLISSDVIGTTFTSLDPSIATVNSQTGRVTRVSNGIARILITGPKIRKRSSVSVSLQTGQNSSDFLSYRSGSAAKAMQDFIYGAVAGTTIGSPNYPEYLFKPYSDPGPFSPQTEPDWNTTNWAVAAGIKVWPISIWNSKLWKHGGATAIHPRFAMVAHHYQEMTQVGITLRWQGENNLWYERTVTNYIQIGSTDLGLCLLNSALPEEVGYARVLPSNWTSYFPTIVTVSSGTPLPSQLAEVPCFSKDKNLKTSGLGWIWDYNNGAANLTSCYGTPSLNSAWAQYYSPGYPGDSSNGICLVHPVHKYLIFLGPQLSGTGCNSVLAHRSDINTAMEALLPGSSLTSADLSMYSTY